MSSNILPIQPKEDQINDAIGNLKTEKQKASDSYFENPISKNISKYTALNKLTSFDKSRSSPRTETEYTVTPDTKKNKFHQPVQMIRILKKKPNRNKV